MRDREVVIRDFVREWVDKAESDLRAAEVLVESEMPDYYPGAFHCQQAAEKFIKAYLVRHQVEFGKTHDLEMLLKLASPVNAKLVNKLESYTWLTPYGVAFRYPGEPVVSHATAQKTLQAARKVKQQIMERLEPYLKE